MEIDIVYDTACPWCFVGMRRLERALADRPSIQPVIRWRPFLLNPEMPRQGVDRKLYLERKFGGPERARRTLEAAESAGRMVGVQFRFDRIKRTPNTIDSHRLIRMAPTADMQIRLINAIFAAYFLEGRDIGSRSELLSIAEEIGLSGEQILARLDSSEQLSDVLSENTRTHAQGLNGVPGFIFNGRYAIAGAQEPPIFLRMIDLALETAVPDAVTTGTEPQLDQTALNQNRFSADNLM